MNSRINVQEVRLIASNGDQVGVVDTSKALELAKEEELDLVEIVPNQTPPVCRIMDYGKFKFENQKKAHAAKKKQKQTQVKEIKFRPNTEEADYQVKLKSLIKFLSGGDKAKITSTKDDIDFKLENSNITFIPYITDGVKDFPNDKQKLKDIIQDIGLDPY